MFYESSNTCSFLFCLQAFAMTFSLLETVNLLFFRIVSWYQTLGLETHSCSTCIQCLLWQGIWTVWAVFPSVKQRGQKYQVHRSDVKYKWFNICKIYATVPGMIIILYKCLLLILHDSWTSASSWFHYLFILLSLLYNVFP